MFQSILSYVSLQVLPSSLSHIVLSFPFLSLRLPFHLIHSSFCLCSPTVLCPSLSLSSVFSSNHIFLLPSFRFPPIPLLLYFLFSNLPFNFLYPSSLSFSIPLSPDFFPICLTSGFHSRVFSPLQRWFWDEGATTSTQCRRDGEDEGGEKGRKRTSVTNLSLRPRPYQQCDEQMEGKRETIKPLVYQRSLPSAVSEAHEYPECPRVPRLPRVS